MSKIPWQDYIAEDRRLCILRVLSELPEGTANDSVLRTALDTVGHRNLSRDTVRTDIRFLLNAGLLTDEWLQDIQICTITLRGVDAANGRIDVKGVKKPSIGS